MESTNRPMAERLVKAFKDLNIARKNILIYPPEHAQAKASINRAFASIQEIMADRNDWTLGVAKNAVIVDEIDLDTANLPYCVELASSLSDHDIAAVTFDRQFEKSGLQQFLGLVAGDQDAARGDFVLREKIAATAIAGITVQFLDYDRIRFTEENEIKQPGTAESVPPSKPNWTDFVSHLLSGSLPAKKEEAIPNEISPAGLAHLINSNRINIDDALSSFNRLLQESIDSAASGDTEDSEAPQGITEMNGLLQHLNPELRQQFLSNIFDCILPQSSTAALALLDQMAFPHVIEMIKQANSAGKKIPSSLINVIKKLEITRGKDDGRVSLTTAENGLPAISGDAAQPRDDRRPETVNFDEDALPDDYRGMLEDLSGQSVPVKADHGVPLEKYIDTLEESHLNGQIGRLLLFFISADVPLDEYQTYAERLLEIVTDLAEAGRFRLPSRVFTAFQQHVEFKRLPEIRSAAADTSRRLQEPPFTSKAVQALCARDGEVEPADFEFIISLGAAIVPDALTVYAQSTKPEQAELAFRLLSAFPEKTLNEVRMRLRDSRTEYLMTMVALVRKLGDKDSLDMLRPLWEHHNADLRLEVLSTLLAFDDKWGLLFLKQWLQSGDPELAAKAISLAAQFKVWDIAGDLAAMLKSVCLFKSDVQRNKTIIAALGRIGNPTAVKPLQKIYRRSISFYLTELKKMKHAVYQSLAGYSREAIVELLAIGLKSTDTTIRGICTGLSSQGKTNETDR